MNDQKTVDELLNEFREVVVESQTDEKAEKEKLLKQFLAGGKDAPFKPIAKPFWATGFDEKSTFYGSPNGLIVRIKKSSGSDYYFEVYHHEGQTVASFTKRPTKGVKTILPLVQELGKKYDFSLSEKELRDAWSILKQFEAIMLSGKMNDILKPAYK